MATDNDCVQYWTHMKDRAAMHISTVTERTDPETEAELKDRVALAFRSGRPHEVAEAVVEGDQAVLEVGRAADELGRARAQLRRAVLERA